MDVLENVLENNVVKIDKNPIRNLYLSHDDKYMYDLWVYYTIPLGFTLF